MSGYQVHPGEMKAHAKHLDAIADRIGNTSGAASNTSSHTEMYGVIGQFLVPAVLTVEGTGLTAIKAAEATTRGISAGVKEMAELYEHNETEIKKLLDGIYGGK